MRKSLYLLIAAALVTGLATPVLAEETAGQLCSAIAPAPQTDLEEPSGLGLEPAAEPALQIGGELCGAVICPVKQHCCNASCSRCVPVGMECTQEACHSTPGSDLETPTSAEPLDVES